MKSKYIAGILALIGGVFGTHKFYLGKTSAGFFRFGLLVFAIMAKAPFIAGILALLGVVEAIILFAMDQREFDQKYNKAPKTRQQDPRQRDADFDRQQTRRRREDYYRERQQPQTRSRPQTKRRENPFKRSGIEKFKDYDFPGAIADFKKALSIDSKDIAVHFNLACAYSLTEQKDNAFFHLSRAVELGFVDFDKIRNHDALAFLRVQEEFEDFVKNGYKLSSAEPDAPKQLESPKENLLDNDLLLEKLKKLGELRDKGLLTEDEFLAQKRKLLGE